MSNENSSIAIADKLSIAESAYEIEMVADTGNLSQLAQKCKYSLKLSLETAYGSWRPVENCKISTMFSRKYLRITHIHYSKSGSPNGIKGTTTDPVLISHYREQYGKANGELSAACARFGSTTLPTLTIVTSELCEPLSYRLV